MNRIRRFGVLAISAAMFVVLGSGSTVRRAGTGRAGSSWQQAALYDA